MKKNNFVDVDSAKQIISGSGNIDYLLDFIEYFEKKIPEEIAQVEEGYYFPYIKCPNFGAWIRIYTEYICNKAIIRLFHALDCIGKKIKDYGYEEAVQGIMNILNSDDFENKSLPLRKVIELRHSIQHGGIPNIIRNIGEKSGVSKTDVLNMTMPKNYSITKKTFSDANELISSLPTKSFVFQDGHIELKIIMKKR